MTTLNEADTRAKLIDPAIYRCGWSEEHISREVTLGAVEVVAGSGMINKPHSIQGNGIDKADAQR